MKRILTMTLVPLTFVGGFAGAVWAAGPQAADAPDTAEIQALDRSAMSITQAIGTVSSQTSGNVMSAAWEQDDATGGWGYEVEIAGTSGQVENWFVNAADGQVKKMAAEADDHESADGE
ncbi:hypothetical protein RPE78_14835 (plasmid) [Thioclava litoralis]|uniref:Peptidase propeptide and YPEB domain-containing protein n=1 Tax=Thioclava litoralis TaxID=3076557 RepID=A0ABZ1E309_9RHOB|nr:hypothetical protein RPE78_14835 [Thioclava sp. FTW29]